MRILFIVNVRPDSGIYVLSKTAAGALEKKGISVDFDRAGGKPDIIHFQNAMPHTFILNKLRYPKTPIVCTTNMTERELKGLVPAFMLPLARAYLDLFYGFCAKIICSTPPIMEQLSAKKELAGKCVLLQNAVNLDSFMRDRKKGREFRKKWGIKKKIVLCVASIQPRKGIFDFAAVAKHLPQYQFVWVGRLPELPTLERKKELEKITKDPGSNIIFPGYMEHGKIAKAYSAADLFVLPSYAETFGLVLVEAAAAGLPIIARDLPEFSIFGDFIIPFSSTAELEEKIVQVLKNKEKHEKYSRLSLEKSLRFEAKAYAERLAAIYEEIIQSKRGHEFFPLNSGMPSTL